MSHTTQAEPTPAAQPVQPATARQPVIEVADLRVTYRGSTTPAVDGVSFGVAAGEIFGFLGPNGAGKSTTQRVLTRQLRSFAGTVRVLDRDLRGWDDAFFEHIGVGFELPARYPRLTVLENLAAFAGLYRRPTEDPGRLLERVGLLEAADQPAGSLSKGMQMRLNLARAMLPRPQILFLDEPTSGLDPVHAEDVRAIVREAAAEGRTVFLTTHDMATADALCDRVAFMVGGRLAAIDTPDPSSSGTASRVCWSSTARVGSCAAPSSRCRPWPATRPSRRCSPPTPSRPSTPRRHHSATCSPTSPGAGCELRGDGPYRGPHPGPRTYLGVLGRHLAGDGRAPGGHSPRLLARRRALCAAVRGRHRRGSLRRIADAAGPNRRRVRRAVHHAARDPLLRPDQGRHPHRPVACPGHGRRRCRRPRPVRDRAGPCRRRLDGAVAGCRLGRHRRARRLPVRVPERCPPAARPPAGGPAGLGGLRPGCPAAPPGADRGRLGAAGGRLRARPPGRLVADAAYLSLWAAGAFILANRRIASIDGGSRAAAPREAARRRARSPRRAPHPLVPAAIDATNAFRNPLALALAASPLVLAAAIRLGLSPLAAWLARAHGVDLTGLEPLIFSGLILLHVPYIFGTLATLLLLDDLDEGGLRALSVSPLGIRGYLCYRMASTALAAFAAVVAASLIAGTPNRIGWPGLVRTWLLAAGCASLVPLTTATLANNRVQGFGILKVLGLAYYLPSLGWIFHGWAPLLLGALPTYWAAALSWGDRAPSALAATLAGSGIIALIAIVELRLGERHLLQQSYAT